LHFIQIFGFNFVSFDVFLFKNHIQKHIIKLFISYILTNLSENGKI
jgi:hypothetical protein